MIALRRKHPTIHRGRFFEGEICPGGLPDLSWHGCQLNSPGWNDPISQTLAMTLGGIEPAEPDFHVMMNMGGDDLSFDIPPLQGKVWKRKVDTSLMSPWDFTDDGQEPAIEGIVGVVNRILVQAEDPIAPVGGDGEYALSLADQSA